MSLDTETMDYFPIYIISGTFSYKSFLEHLDNAGYPNELNPASLLFALRDINFSPCLFVECYSKLSVTKLSHILQFVIWAAIRGRVGRSSYHLRGSSLQIQLDWMIFLQLGWHKV